MRSQIDHADLETQVQELTMQMVRIAFQQYDSLPPAILVQLQKKGLLQAVKLSDPSSDILAAIRDPDYLNQEDIPYGPLVFVRNQNPQKQWFVVKAENLLFADDARARMIAVDYLDKLSNSSEDLLSQHSRTILRKDRDNVASNDPKHWRTAALHIERSIREDWQCNLAALRQSLRMNFQEGITDYLPRIMRPSIASLNFIRPEILNPSAEKDQIREIIADCVGSGKDLTDALTVYHDKLGHLPLGEDLSFPYVIDEWRKTNCSPEDFWKTMWAWADQKHSPVARYHVCYYFVCRPSDIPQGQEAILWQEMCQIIHLPRGEEDELQWTPAWRLRCEMAKHFCDYFGCCLPGSDSERVANASWWCAERVAALFDNSSEVMQHFRKTTLAPEADLSSYIWQVCHPVVKPSLLRYATIYVGSLWSLSLLCELAKNFSSLKPGTIHSEDRDRITSALHASVIGLFPPQINDDNQRIFAFERGVLGTAQAWLDSEQDESSRRALQAFILAHESITDYDVAIKKFHQLPKTHLGDRTLLGVWLRVSAYLDKIPVESVWDCVSNEEWREDVFLKGDLKVLELIADSLTEIQSRHNDKWSSHLPHFYAYACESVSDDPERKKLLFAFTLLSCVSSDSVGALERLRHNLGHREFLEEANHWRNIIEQIQDEASSWVAGRLRAVLAALDQ